ncbi:MAG: [protein-PII] uridylyltransferase [Chromatiales bacterium 21-64-14]|nr:MAG: [protein-PII] uridylyltransferase [Chromatiales bacterium 21-64-14]HQU15146.1 [protein-PII] uridylyltransferase [Gammaproteobacteria bacterium]
MTSIPAPPAGLDPASVQRARIAGEPPLAIFRRALDTSDAELARRFAEDAPADELVHGRARQVDGVLIAAWRELLGGAGPDLALVAVGGYGRGELHPCSDIDLMILVAQGVDREHHREGIERYLTLLWDLGLDVGHSVRSVDDCVREAQQDITVATNLMEARLLTGPEALLDALRAATGPDRLWPSRAFFEAKRKEQQTRHTKFHDTAYNLEPNIKEGPGGLRDIQMVGWVAKRHFGAATLHDLVAHGFLTEAEYQALADGQNHLWRIRFALHDLTGRREDRLLFDHQAAVARRFGYQDADHNLGVEQFMQVYYRTVMELGRLNEMLLQLFQEAILYGDDPGAPVPINRRFQARNGFIEVTGPDVFRHYPFALLEIFLLLQQHSELTGVRASTIRLIRAHRKRIDDKFRADLRARSLFMEILRQPRGVAHELRRMNRYGILAAYIPAFGQVVGRMQYDLFHVYTVDEHTLTLVRNLRRFTVAEFSHEFPLCSGLIQQLPKPELLYIAALFHDIAKGRGGDHSELGAADAEAFCRAHGLSQYDTRLVCWLVRNHLIFSLTAQRRDISDPQVIHGFAQKVGDQAHLDYLYLLTVADIRATNPELWNAWRQALLLELYNAVTRALRRGLENPIDKQERIAEAQEEAGAELRRLGLGEEAIDQVWDEVSEDYFLRYLPDEIVWHTEAIAGCTAADLPLVLVRPHSTRGGTQIFLYTAEADHLFATATAALDQLGLTIVDARIIKSRHGFTLDTYLVLEADGGLIEQPYRLDEIRVTLQRRLRTPERSVAVTRHPSRHLKHFSIPTQLDFVQDDSNRRTVIDLLTGDRPGLLSQVGQAFHRCGVRVQNAKVTTIGAQANDVFFVTDLRNEPLSEERIRELRGILSAALDQNDPGRSVARSTPA